MITTKTAIEDKVIIRKVSNFLLNNLSITYKDISKYILSFIHKSIVNERSDYAPNHNERLEFLWDAVLELIITDNLYKKFPNKPEWDLTDLRSAIVRWSNLAKVGKSIWLPDFLLLWKWEELSWWRTNDYIIANCLEAFLGAIYLDLWYEESKNFVLNYIYPTIDSILENNLTKDYKTIIQEYSQAEFDITPSYKVLSDSWPDHDKIYEVWVFLWDKLVWIWKWSSKKKAQEVSAQNWFEHINDSSFKKEFKESI